MQEKFEKNLNKVEEIIEGFDKSGFKFDESAAKAKLVEGNKLLDECVEMINRKN